MGDHADKVWDEYDWEIFLQQQEQRAGKYIELLEKYHNHPQREEIIAQEMGLAYLDSDEWRNWEEEMDAKFEHEIGDIERIIQNDEAASGKNGDSDYESHPLYPLNRETAAFSSELESILFEMPPNVQEHPTAVTLHNQTSLAASKIAAALDDDDIEELGMSIAYLKRALYSITAALDAVSHLHDGSLIDAAKHDHVRTSLFHIRDGIVSAMGDYRAEFRKRHSR